MKSRPTSGRQSEKGGKEAEEYFSRVCVRPRLCAALDCGALWTVCDDSIKVTTRDKQAATSPDTPLSLRFPSNLSSLGCFGCAIWASRTVSSCTSWRPNWNQRQSSGGSFGVQWALCGCKMGAPSSPFAFGRLAGGRNKVDLVANCFECVWQKAAIWRLKQSSGRPKTEAKEKAQAEAEAEEKRRLFTLA